MSAGARRWGACLWSCALGACLFAGCKSQRQRCDEARDAAMHAWASYTEALESARAHAVTTQREAHAKLSAEIEPRLAPQAQKLADGRYDHSNSAWLRAYQSAYHEACAKDAECARLSHDNAEATTAIEDLQERLVLARAAREIASGDPERAQKASKAVIVHPEYPQLKLAQQLTETTSRLCTDAAPKAQGTP